jgi:hypothetical protein
MNSDKEVGIFIKKLGKYGDLKEGFGYFTFYGNEEFKGDPRFFNFVTIKEFDKHIILEVINDRNIKYLFGIEPLTNLEKADARAYQNIKEMATGIFAYLKRDTKIKIFDKTENLETLEEKVKA